jgi:hypothetical protein
MNRTRGGFVAGGRAASSTSETRGGIRAADRSLGRSFSVAAARLPRDGGAAKRRAGYWKIARPSESLAFERKTE